MSGYIVLTKTGIILRRKGYDHTKKRSQKTTAFFMGKTE